MIFYYFIPFSIILIFIITAVSNGANITDGIDGLCTGVSAISGVALVVLTYLTGNIIFSDYLNILFIATICIIIRKELIIPILCGVFLVENLSVMLQVAYFKYTRRKYGEGRRIFLMSPLHHHYQKMGIHEAKIVARFWIVGILLAILAIVFLKVR